MRPTEQLLIGLGYNATDFLPFSVEPYTDGLAYPRQITAGDGTVYDDGQPFILLLFKVLEADQYMINMQRAGVYAAKSAKVTIQVPDDSRIARVSYNGVAVQPEAGVDRTWDGLHWNRVNLLVRKLVAI